MGNRTRAAAAAIASRFGRKVVGSGRSMPTRDRRLSSGSLALDYALGGGIPVGRSILFWGDKSGGKTTSALRVGAVNQTLCRHCLRPAKDIEAIPPTKEEMEEDPDARWSAVGSCTCFAEGLFVPEPPRRGSNEKAKDFTERYTQWREALTENSYGEFVVAFVDPEDAFHADWGEEVGLDTRRVLYVRPATGEEAVDIVHTIITVGDVDLLIVDSLAHFTPREEYEKSAEDWQRGLQARVVNKGIRKFVGGAVIHKRQSDTDGVTQIWTNQTRINIAKKFGDPTVKPAGKGQEFAVHVEIRFLESKAEVVEEKYGTEKETTSIPTTELIRFKVTKNKTAGTLGVEESFKQTMRGAPGAPGGTVLEDDFLFKLVMKHLIVEDKKQKEPYGLGEQRFRTQAKLKEALRDDAELRAACRGLVLEKMLAAR
jgi:RecA/RadA recombinase